MNNELNTCVLCGKKYTGYGNSTSGFWNDDETGKKGQTMLCCDDCNITKVLPARLRKMKELKTQE